MAADEDCQSHAAVGGPARAASGNAEPRNFQNKGKSSQVKKAVAKRVSSTTSQPSTPKKSRTQKAPESDPPGLMTPEKVSQAASFLNEIWNVGPDNQNFSGAILKLAEFFPPPSSVGIPVTDTNTNTSSNSTGASSSTSVDPSHAIAQSLVATRIKVSRFSVRKCQGKCELCFDACTFLASHFDVQQTTCLCSKCFRDNQKRSSSAQSTGKDLLTTRVGPGAVNLRTRNMACSTKSYDVEPIYNSNGDLLEAVSPSGSSSTSLSSSLFQPQNEDYLIGDELDADRNVVRRNVPFGPVDVSESLLHSAYFPTPVVDKARNALPGVFDSPRRFVTSPEPQRSPRLVSAGATARVEQSGIAVANPLAASGYQPADVCAQANEGTVQEQQDASEIKSVAADSDDDAASQVHGLSDQPFSGHVDTSTAGGAVMHAIHTPTSSCSDGSSDNAIVQEFLLQCDAHQSDHATVGARFARDGDNAGCDTFAACEAMKTAALDQNSLSGSFFASDAPRLDEQCGNVGMPAGQAVKYLGSLPSHPAGSTHCAHGHSAQQYLDTLGVSLTNVRQQIEETYVPLSSVMSLPVFQPVRMPNVQANSEAQSVHHDAKMAALLEFHNEYENQQRGIPEVPILEAVENLRNELELEVEKSNQLAHQNHVLQCELSNAFSSLRIMEDNVKLKDQYIDYLKSKYDIPDSGDEAETEAASFKSFEQPALENNVQA